MNTKNYEKFLIIGPSWVGDMVMAQSLFISLKRLNPDSWITVMAPDWTRPLLERMPEVDDSIDAGFAHGELKLGARREMGKSLRREGFTSAIVLPNSFKSALIPFHAKIPKRIGWRGEWRVPLLTDCRRLDKELFPLMVQRFAALASAASPQPPQQIPEPSLRVEGRSAAKAVKEFDLGNTSRVIAFCPGAEFGESKQWPAQHFADLANSMIDDGWSIWIFGSANDSVAAEAILADVEPEKLGSCRNLAGQTSLSQAIDLMSLAALVVSNDSGLMHIAAALNKPVVSLYGSTSPDFTPPLTAKVKLLTTDIECRPCFKRECPYGHKKCLTELRPAMAESAVRELIKSEYENKPTQDTI